MPDDCPKIVVLNHPSWWDPLVALVLTELFPDHAHHAPMDADALGHDRIFERLGVFGRRPEALARFGKAIVVERGADRPVVQWRTCVEAALASTQDALACEARPRDPSAFQTRKQYACSLLARAARHPLLVFLDADVRLATDGLARMAAFLDESRTDLASGIPRQETGTLVEKLVIPLNHFVLLGFLPLARMRGSGHPAYAAGCGQFFMVRRFAYEAAGGHTALQASLHSVSTEKLLHHRLDCPRCIAFEPIVHVQECGLFPR